MLSKNILLSNEHFIKQIPYVRGMSLVAVLSKTRSNTLRNSSDTIANRSSILRQKFKV